MWFHCPSALIKVEAKINGRLHITACNIRKVSKIMKSLKFFLICAFNVLVHSAFGRALSSPQLEQLIEKRGLVCFQSLKHTVDVEHVWGSDGR